MGKGVRCPVCGMQLHKGDIRLGDFSCPKCGARLFVDDRNYTPIILLSLPAAFLILYHAPLRGVAYFFLSLLLGGIVNGCLAFLLTLWRPRLRQRAPCWGVDFKITSPPMHQRRSNNQAASL